MGVPSVGSVVLVRFPFSDLSDFKLRPAVILAMGTRGDRIVCQVTSNPYGDPAAVAFDNTHLRTGTLRVESFARPSKLFTTNDSIIVSAIAELKDERRTEIFNAAITLFQGALS